MKVRKRKVKPHTPSHHFFVDGGAQREQSSRAGQNVWEPAGALIADRALARVRNALGETSASRPAISERSKDRPREKGRRAGAQHIKSLNDGAAREGDAEVFQQPPRSPAEEQVVERDGVKKRHENLISFLLRLARMFAKNVVQSFVDWVGGRSNGLRRKNRAIRS